MSLFAKLNGKVFKQEEISISPNNRSFRYGDGFFETIKIIKGRIVLKELHFERFFASLELMQFDKPAYFTAEYLAKHILELAIKNNHQALARVRLTVFRGDGGLYEAANHFPNHLIQSWALSNVTSQLNENGLVIDIYREARKNCDSFSGVKSNNFQSYVMASLWAKKQRLNDCILLNPFDRVADATIANVFIVKDGVIKTPPLTDGPVNGVMRRHLINSLKEASIPIEEMSISADDIAEASEVFLTNAIFGLRWVKQAGNSMYSNKFSASIHRQYIAPLFSV
jgi:branched-subunit amino acid aminotransferase/4-amino-4-deoxychorismate lyase